MIPKNYIDELRKKYFSVQLHLFDYKKTYSDIVTQQYAVMKIQSVKDFADAAGFADRHNCVLLLFEVKEVLGLVAVIRQRNPYKPLFFNINRGMFIPLVCVN